MHVLAIDDERLALEQLIFSLKETLPKAQIHGFINPEKALEFVQTLNKDSKHPLDLAFLDIIMSRMSGLEVAARLKKIFPEVRIIFVTGYSDYAYDAFRLHAKGYILKPVSRKLIQEELDNLDFPQEAERRGKRVQIHTFGTFDIFVDQKPLSFSRSRAKELLAYLVDRQGNGVSLSNICAVLFEDSAGTKGNKKHAQNVISSLRRALESVDAEDILIKKWNYLALDTKKVDCDYYRFLKGDIDAINAFHGEYMSNYSWAEFTAAFLNQKSTRHKNRQN
ncbi:response regulator [Eubacterium sp. 1001713B170207_170306_E7]|uniref:response regulator n=1 Tax=Eubacterium sp. 1001713B170207_170306_E7 TaxID=2787097 RepID=UPI00189BC71D|nr:response regulator [Eubacterium sp. 1001713B170207_170306_E7]